MYCFGHETDKPGQDNSRRESTSAMPILPLSLLLLSNVVTFVRFIPYIVLVITSDAFFVKEGNHALLEPNNALFCDHLFFRLE